MQPVEGRRGGRPERGVHLAGLQVSVGGEHAQHGGQAGREHPGSLGHPPNGPAIDAAERDLHHRVCSPDRVGGGQAAGPGGFGHGGVDAGEQLVHRQPLADQAGRADRHLPGPLFLGRQSADRGG